MPPSLRCFGVSGVFSNFLEFMSLVLNFFEWLYSILRKGLEIVVSLSGQIVTAIASVVGVVSTMFSNFEWLQGATDWVNGATTKVSSFVNAGHSELFEIFFGWFALDTFVQVCGVVVSCTFGVACIVFVTIFTAVFGLVPVVLGIRSICKALKVVSVGYVEP